jgi:HEAT repeat protein
MSYVVHVCGVLLLSTATPDEVELQQHLASKDVQTRVQAVSRLAIEGSNARPFIPVLIKGLQSEKEPAVRIEFLNALASIDISSDTVIREIVAHFNDPDFEVRAAALESAHTKIGVNGVKHYVQFVNDKKNATYGWYGIAAIGFTYKNNKDAEVARCAVKCLEEKFNHANLNTRLWATYSFQFLAGRKRTEDSLPIIADAFVKFDGVRSHFIHLFKAYGDRSLPFLKSALTNPDEEVRVYALSSLGNLGRVARPSLPEIERAQSDPSPDVSFMARFVHKEILNSTK